MSLVAFIGMTLEATPDIVSAAGIRGLSFEDEIETANALVPRLQRRGVESIVVLLHEGGFTSDSTVYDACPGISGPVIDINDGLDPTVDAIVSGHTHQPYNCELADSEGTPRLLTSASSFGRTEPESRSRFLRSFSAATCASCGAISSCIAVHFRRSGVITTGSTTNRMSALLV